MQRRGKGKGGEHLALAIVRESSANKNTRDFLRGSRGQKSRGSYRRDSNFASNLQERIKISGEKQADTMTFNVDAFVINNRNRNETIEILASFTSFRASISVGKEKSQFRFNRERFVSPIATISRALPCN